MADKQWDLCVLGAGPSGLEAATAASSCGLDVAVLDEHGGPGGHIYMGIESPFAASHMDRGMFLQGNAALRRFRQSGAEFLPRHTVWFASPREIIARHENFSRSIRTRSLIIANGAMERPVPFPGWTLPGVMSAGGADLLRRSAGMIPREPIALAGNGPMILLIAARLLSIGINCSVLLDTGMLKARIKSLLMMPASLFDLPYLAEGLRMIWTVLKERLPIIPTKKFRAYGRNRIEEVICSTPSGERRFEAATLLVHEGFIPRTHFSRLMRCRHVWHRTRRYWRPACTGVGASLNTPGVYFTGDGQDVHGADAALLKGHLAGIDAARMLGAVSAAEAKYRSYGACNKLKGLLFARAYAHALFEFDPAMYQVPDETTICRCEQITAGQVKNAIQEGCLDVNDIKTRTRAGMGQCQGRMCGQAVAEIAAATLHISPDRPGMLSVRPPLRPVPMREFCEYERQA
jgi:bacterioferritin-associated ferredoxin